MVDRHQSEPSDSVSSAVGDQAADAFAVLGNDTRLAILLALWDRYEPFSEGSWDPTTGNPVTFSTLRDDVGVDDSGQFNYHLGKLEDLFVERTDEGYQLLPAGHRLARTVIAGIGVTEGTFEAAPLDLECPQCGGTTEITYRDQRLYRVCGECPGMSGFGPSHPSGVLSAWRVAPNVLLDRPVDEIYTAVNTSSVHGFGLRHAGVCPVCMGPVSRELDLCGDHVGSSNGPCPECGRRFAAMIRFACRACKDASTCPAWLPAWGHHTTSAFAWRHGFDIWYGEMAIDQAQFGQAVEITDDIESIDPLRILVTYRYGDDVVELTLDEELAVIDVEEPGPDGTPEDFQSRSLERDP